MEEEHAVLGMDIGRDKQRSDFTVSITLWPVRICSISKSAQVSIVKGQLGRELARREGHYVASRAMLGFDEDGICG